MLYQRLCERVAQSIFAGTIAIGQQSDGTTRGFYVIDHAQDLLPAGVDDPALMVRIRALMFFVTADRLEPITRRYRLRATMADHMAHILATYRPDREVVLLLVLPGASYMYHIGRTD